MSVKVDSTLFRLVSLSHLILTVQDKYIIGPTILIIIGRYISLLDPAGFCYDIRQPYHYAPAEKTSVNIIGLHGSRFFH